MVCACRQDGPIKSAVDAYPGFSKQYITKSLAMGAPRQLIANTSDAQNILIRIEGLL